MDHAPGASDGEHGEEAGDRLFSDIAMSRWLSARDATTMALCTLLRRVTGGQARDFVRTAPPSLRDILRSCAESRTEAPEGFNRDMYLRRISMLLGTPEERAELLVRDVFLAIHRYIGRGEVERVAGQLPEDLGRLWLHP